MGSRQLPPQQEEGWPKAGVVWSINFWTTPPRLRGLRSFATFVAVGMEITLHPPHRSGRTDFPYPALASGQRAKRADGYG